jgi:hypothetical protein
MHLLQASNRLVEAEPLSRRELEILLRASAASGYEHPYRRTALASHVALLKQLGRSESEIDRELQSILESCGFNPPA